MSKLMGKLGKLVSKKNHKENDNNKGTKEPRTSLRMASVILDGPVLGRGGNNSTGDRDRDIEEEKNLSDSDSDGGFQLRAGESTAINIFKSEQLALQEGGTAEKERLLMLKRQKDEELALELEVERRALQCELAEIAEMKSIENELEKRGEAAMRREESLKKKEEQYRLMMNMMHYQAPTDSKTSNINASRLLGQVDKKKFFPREIEAAEKEKEIEKELEFRSTTALLEDRKREAELERELQRRAEVATYREKQKDLSNHGMINMLEQVTQHVSRSSTGGGSFHLRTPSARATNSQTIGNNSVGNQYTMRPSSSTAALATMNEGDEGKDTTVSLQYMGSAAAAARITSSSSSATTASTTSRIICSPTTAATTAAVPTNGSQFDKLFPPGSLDLNKDEVYSRPRRKSGSFLLTSGESQAILVFNRERLLTVTKAEEEEREKREKEKRDAELAIEIELENRTRSALLRERKKELEANQEEKDIYSEISDKCQAAQERDLRNGGGRQGSSGNANGSMNAGEQKIKKGLKNILGWKSKLTSLRSGNKGGSQSSNAGEKHAALVLNVSSVDNEEYAYGSVRSSFKGGVVDVSRHAGNRVRKQSLSGNKSAGNSPVASSRTIRSPVGPVIREDEKRKETEKGRKKSEKNNISTPVVVTLDGVGVVAGRGGRDKNSSSSESDVEATTSEDVEEDAFCSDRPMMKEKEKSLGKKELPVSGLSSLANTLEEEETLEKRERKEKQENPKKRMSAMFGTLKGGLGGKLKRGSRMEKDFDEIAREDDAMEEKGGVGGLEISSPSVFGLSDDNKLNYQHHQSRKALLSDVKSGKKLRKTSVFGSFKPAGGEDELQIIQNLRDLEKQRVGQAKLREQEQKSTDAWTARIHKRMGSYTECSSVCSGSGVVTWEVVEGTNGSCNTLSRVSSSNSHKNCNITNTDSSSSSSSSSSGGCKDNPPPLPPWPNSLQVK